jgi:hypothetical protein
MLDSISAGNEASTTAQIPLSLMRNRMPIAEPARCPPGWTRRLGRLFPRDDPPAPSTRERWLALETVTAVQTRPLAAFRRERNEILLARA